LRNLKHEDAVNLLNNQKDQVELELLFVSPDEDMVMIKGSKSGSEIVNGASNSDVMNNSSTTVECQTDNSNRKHVTFEDSISLTDSNLDPPVDDPADEHPDTDLNQANGDPSGSDVPEHGSSNE